MRRPHLKKQVDLSEVVVNTGNGHGSSSTAIRRFTNTEKSVGTAISYPGDSSTLGSVFTITKGGIYTISYFDYAFAASANLGVSLNSAQLTTGITAITQENRLMVATSQSNQVMGISVTRRLVAGDVIRPHTGGDTTATTVVKFSITRDGD